MDIKYEVITNLYDAEELSSNLPTFSDIETGDWYQDIRFVQVFQPQTYDRVLILDTDIISLNAIKEAIKPLHTVWYGGNFDLGALKMHTAKTDDLMYACKIAFPSWSKMKVDKGSKPYSLDTAVKRLGFEHLYGDINKKKMQKAGFLKGAYISHEQKLYCSTDVVALSLMWSNKNLQHVINNVSAYKLDIKNLEYCSIYQQNGLIPDLDDVRREKANLIEDIKANDLILGDVNPNSPKQVKEVLGTDSSDKNTLIRLIAEDNKLAKAVYDQRRLLKRRTMLTSYDKPKVYTIFNPYGTVTGRFSSTGKGLTDGINSQQIPRQLQYIFHRDTEDTVVIHADYSTAELRAGASIMKDRVMYQELMDNIDLHVEAAILAGVDRKIMVPSHPDFKENRTKGKTISFGKIFGQAALGFIEYAYVNYGVVFTLEESKEIHAKYHNKYKGIHRYHQARWKDYKEKPVVTPMGHRNMANLGTDAINYATQGAVGECTKLASHYLIRGDKNALKYIFNIVHDAIDLRVPRGTEELWVSKLGDSMKKGWVELCKTPMMVYKDIPMPIEIEYSGKTVIY